jgi:hypothetical protein
MTSPRRSTYRIATLSWAGALLFGSLQPIRPGNIHFGLLHHIAHFLGFGMLAFLAVVGFGNPGWTVLRPAAGAFLFGFAIEFLQHWQNRMPVEWYDVRDDAVGILVFTALCHTLSVTAREVSAACAIPSDEEHGLR